VAVLYFLFFFFFFFFFFQAEDGIRDRNVTGVQTCALPIYPVTGSAHCALAPYWSAKLAKQELRAYQASARGGELMLRLVGDRVRSEERRVGKECRWRGGA